MPLTPQDVSQKRFTPVRLREGYDMSEVDQFLDEVEAELGRLVKENDDLRSQLTSVQSGGKAEAKPADAKAAPAEKAGDKPADKAADAKPAEKAAPVAATTAPAAVETIRVETVAEASNAATRLIEIATRTHDEMVDDAKSQAQTILDEARENADRLTSETKEKADTVESEARGRAQKLDQETAERRQQVFGDIERERDRLASEVDNLRSFEREYRSRLKAYFHSQLEALDAPTDTPVGDTGEAPQRLRSVLGDDEA